MEVHWNYLTKKSVIHFQELILVNLYCQTGINLCFLKSNPERVSIIQEILGEKPTLAFSGWFHFTDSNMLTKYASREQLSNKTDKICELKNRIPRSIYDLSNKYELSSKDILFLSGWISAEYLTKANISAIRKKFSSDKCVQLRFFLKPQISENINALLFGKRRTDKSTGRHKKMSRNWKVNGPPHKHRYLS